MHFNQDGAISLNDKSLKLVDQYPYILSTESYINGRLGKATTAID